MIYTRFGGTVKVLRYPLQVDVLRLDPPLDDEAMINLATKSWALVDMGSGAADGDRIVKIADLRADDGWKEIAVALGKEWQCPDCGEGWPTDERCHNAKCRKKQDARLKRWRAKLTA